MEKLLCAEETFSYFFLSCSLKNMLILNFALARSSLRVLQVINETVSEVRGESKTLFHGTGHNRGSSTFFSLGAPSNIFSLQCSSSKNINYMILVYIAAVLYIFAFIMGKAKRREGDRANDFPRTYIYKRN